MPASTCLSVFSTGVTLQLILCPLSQRNSTTTSDSARLKHFLLIRIVAVLLPVRVPAFATVFVGGVTLRPMPWTLRLCTRILCNFTLSVLQFCTLRFCTSKGTLQLNTLQVYNYQFATFALCDFSLCDLTL